MKIAILSFYSGLIDRGVETWATNLEKKVNSNLKIDIIGGNGYRKKIDWEQKNFWYQCWLLLRHAVKYLHRWVAADVVVPTNGTVQTFFCRLVTWIVGKQMIVFGHSGPGADDKWNLLCSPNVFVAFSHSQVKWARDHKFSWTKIQLIHHAVDTDKFKPARVKPKDKIVLCVAANTKDKRVHLVGEAVGLLPDVRFMAVGKGNPIEVSHSQMPKIYQKASIFCFVPQPWEAFGLVYLEALASNLPVVTIDDATRHEIVGEAGIFVKNPKDTKKLAAAIELALKSKWDKKPYHQAEKFSWDKVLPEYRKLFERS